MDELALLKPKLARLKLSGMLDTLSERLSQALAEKWSYTQFLDTLLTDEAERRDFKQLGRRLTKSGLSPDKTLETFDFSFNPRIHAPTLRELATCRFVASGLRMSFWLVQAASARATQLRRSGTSPVARDTRSPTSAPACCSTGFTPVAATPPTSAGCHQVGTVALLVLDDFGLTPLPEHQQQDLYEVICNRYERHATVITSNRDFNEWPLVFANPLMASATMDRLVHRAVKIVIEGKSYRMESFVRRSRELPQPSEDPQ